MVIADLGNPRPGTPALTTGLRGASEDSMCDLHAPDERVLLSELRSTVVALAGDHRAAHDGAAGGTR
ncbi:hypothetical protein [Streptomyces xanthophaeus]|uniref:hypothetical protein n=1 Tax=Streptomyces xanthophaeus TaxID=67385 RepID=UPI003F4CF234